MTTTLAHISGHATTEEYVSYYERYVSRVKGDDIVSILTAQLPDTLALLSKFREDQGDYRYAPGKWTVKEMLGHLIDSERVFAYRALRFARADQTPLPGFEQDEYVRNGPHTHVALAALIEEFTHVRKATISFFRNLSPNDWSRRGSANNSEVTVRGLAYIIAGHELHHRALLEEKYLR